MSARYLHRVLFPESIAVFGAGDKEARLAGIVLNNIASGGYRGRVLAVGPGTAIKGIPSYPDIGAIEGPVDLGVMSAPPAQLLNAIASFGKIKPAGLIITSQSYADSQFHQEMLACASSAGIRLIGPHSWGVYNPMVSLNAGFATHPAFVGELAVVSQSSAICATILDLSVTRKIGIRFMVGLGDMIDVDFADAIDYLTNNASVRGILLHVESLRNLRRFMSASRAAARIKPIIVLKTDRHRPAYSTLQAPGANVLDEISIYDAAFKRAGIIRVETVEGLFDCAELVSKKVRPKGARLVIISDSKTPATMAVDALRDRGVAPAVIADDTIAEIDQILSTGWSRGNPICTRTELTPEMFAELLSCFQAVPSIDGILILLSPQFITDPETFAGDLISALKQVKIPVFAAWMGGERIARARRILNDAGISTNETPERAVRAFMYLYTCESNQRLLQEIPSREADFTFNASGAREIIASAAHRTTSEFPEDESMALLKSYGFLVGRMPPSGFVEEDDSRNNMAARIHEPDLRIVAGSRMIPDFGPVLFVGPDGEISNLFRSWAIGLPPLNHTLARHMLLSSPAMVRFLEARGRDTESDLRVCEELMIKLSHLVADFSQISETDLDISIFPDHQAIVARAKIIAAAASIPAPLHLIISPYPSRYETAATAKSGLSLLIRPLKPEDAYLLQTLWVTFSPRTLYYRFSRHTRDLSPELLVTLTQIDYDREIALAAFRNAESGGEMLGVGRLYGEIGAHIAEFSVVVGDPWQGLGIGAQLLSHLIAIARDRHIKTIWGLIQWENKNMIELARSLNFNIMVNPGDPQVEATLTIFP